MAISRLSKELADEIAHNVERLRADLTRFKDPDGLDSGEELGEPFSTMQFEAADAQEWRRLDPLDREEIEAFYRMLGVLVAGHPGLFGSEPDRLTTAYRITLEAAIDLGKRLIQPPGGAPEGDPV